MDQFDFTVPAEVYATRGRGNTKRPVKFHRFDTAAEAIRFIMEQLPADVQGGTVMEIEDDRFQAAEIRQLYEHPDYPLSRPGLS